MLAIGTNRGEIKVVDSLGRIRFHREERHGKVFCVSLSPDGRTLASGSQDGKVRVWDLGSGSNFLNVKANSAGAGYEGFHEPPCRAVAWSPSSCILASGDESGQLCLWNVAGAQENPLQRLGGDRGGVLCVAFSPDGSGRVASGGGRGSITVWDRDGAVEWTRADAAGQVPCVDPATPSSLLDSHPPPLPTRRCRIPAQYCEARSEVVRQARTWIRE